MAPEFFRVLRFLFKEGDHPAQSFFFFFFFFLLLHPAESYETQERTTKWRMKISSTEKRPTTPLLARLWHSRARGRGMRTVTSYCLYIPKGPQAADETLGEYPGLMLLERS